MFISLNPLSDFLKSAKDGTRLEDRLALVVKHTQFINDVYEEKAIDEHLRKITLGKQGATEDRVDKIAGVWHVQKNFPYEITRVRKRDMVLLEKLDRTEHTLFEYWTAKFVGYNCYGPFISKDKTADCIVAKYETDNGVYWGYGATLESARAFLGLKLYDEYKDLINAVACKNKLQNQKK